MTEELAGKIFNVMIIKVPSLFLFLAAGRKGKDYFNCGVGENRAADCNNAIQL
jgi:hypothetical protein